VAAHCHLSGLKTRTNDKGERIPPSNRSRLGEAQPPRGPTQGAPSTRRSASPTKVRRHRHARVQRLLTRYPLGTSRPLRRLPRQGAVAQERPICDPPSCHADSRPTGKGRGGGGRLRPCHKVEGSPRDLHARAASADVARARGHQLVSAPLPSARTVLPTASTTTTASAGAQPWCACAWHRPGGADRHRGRMVWPMSRASCPHRERHAWSVSPSTQPRGAAALRPRWTGARRDGLARRAMAPHAPAPTGGDACLVRKGR
jgi:hypothetical protein